MPDYRVSVLSLFSRLGTKCTVSKQLIWGKVFLMACILLYKLLSDPPHLGQLIAAGTRTQINWRDHFPSLSSLSLVSRPFLREKGTVCPLALGRLAISDGSSLALEDQWSTGVRAGMTSSRTENTNSMEFQCVCVCVCVRGRACVYVCACVCTTLRTALSTAGKLNPLYWLHPQSLSWGIKGPLRDL